MENNSKHGCYTFSVVEYIKLGRKLGIGTRVAAKILRQRAQSASSSTPSVRAAADPQSSGQRPAPAQRSFTAKSPLPRNVASAKVIRGVAAGSRGFGRGFWKQFSVAAGALWHQITGVFFAIFAVFFAQNLWRVRGAWRFGPEHGYFIIYLIVTVLFAYFSINAFTRSRGSRR